MSEMAAKIEQYLLSTGSWVPAKTLCERFGIRERALRGIDGRPGLASDFAISGDRGYKHVELATTREWLRFKFRTGRHGVGELRRLRRLSKRRAHVCKKSAPVVEKDTGQLVFFSSS